MDEDGLEQIQMGQMNQFGRPIQHEVDYAKSGM
jgi:hypothetical protein